jgi:hypothetical protein
LGDGHFAPFADYAAAPATELRWRTRIIKVGENLERFAASQVSLMRNPAALLALIGEIIHGDSEYWGILLIKHHGRGHVQSRCAVHFY